MVDPISLISTDALTAWAGKTYGKSLVEKVFTKLSDEWKKVDWVKESQEYCNRIEQRYGTIQVLGMSSPMQLSELFTDVHILDKLTAHQYLQSEHWEELQEQYFSGKGYVKHDEERRKGDDVAKEFNRLFILGKPGAGKTTFLKHIAITTVNEKLERLPVFVPLKAFADSGQKLLEYIVQQFDVCGFPDAKVVVEYLLSTGKAIVLFDGLDEVQTEHDKRSSVITALTEFGTKYPQSQIIISCRIAANEYQFEGYQYVEMADFNEEQIATFVKNWFTNNETKHEGFKEEFQHSNLQELAQSPLLLVLLCMVYESTMTLPTARAALYAEAVDALLKKWDISRNIKRSPVYQELNIIRMQQLLTLIAAENFENKQFLFRQNELEQHIVRFIKILPNAGETEAIDGEVILKAIEVNHGILVERAQKVYSFSHLTFQEYFTARYIIEEGGLSLQGLFTHLTDETWEEVFLLTAQMLKNAEPFFEIFLHSLNTIIKEEKKILQMLTWARNKVVSIQSDYPFESTISFYLFIGLAPYPMYKVDESKKSITAFNFASELADVLGFGSLLDSDLALDYQLTGLIYPFTVNYDEDIEGTYKSVRKRSKKMRLTHFIEDIEQLKLAKNPTDQEIENFSDLLQPITQKHRNIGHEWNLSSNQQKIMNTYLKANTLLVKCLKIAAIANRDKIISQLLLPPS